MNKILILIVILLILTLVYFISYKRIDNIRKRIIYNEDNIKNSLNKKCELINEMNIETKKKLDKKYLKDYINLESKSLSLIELDMKLNDAMKVIKDIRNDIPDIKSKQFNKLYNELERNDEELTTGKNLYNKYADMSNKLIRKFPNNIVSKTMGVKVKAFYN
jgi:hypothetical protein